MDYSSGILTATAFWQKTNTFPWGRFGLLEATEVGQFLKKGDLVVR